MDTMKYVRAALMCFAVITGLSAATQDVTIQTQSNYNSWGTGWDSVYVMKNNVTTIAIVPKIGGRIMQYDIAGHASMYVDNTNKGKVPTASALLGGFRTLASPQSSFTWPPSPRLEVGAYTCAIRANTADSGVIYLESQVENTTNDNLPNPNLDGLQFKRTITLYKSSSHVKVEMTMANKGAKTLVPHGIWDITECVCMNNNVLDTSNIWLYFPLNPASTMGGGKGYAQLQGTDASQWKPNTAPGGIMGVVYRRKEAKIGADSKAGWICYVDRLGGYAYVKRFMYETGKTYPDSGSSVEVYTSGTTAFLEEEVMGPLATLAPNDSVAMTENWFAARSLGPVLAVNDAGLITNKLTVQQSHDTVKAQGTYGVFYQGIVKSLFKNGSGTTVAVADSHAVSPLDSFACNATLKVPATAAKLILASYGAAGEFIGDLDSASLQTAIIPPPGSTLREKNRIPEIAFNAKGNYLSIRTPLHGRYSLELIDLRGKRVAAAWGKMPSFSGISMATIPWGVYIVKMALFDSGGAPAGSIEARRVLMP